MSERIVARRTVQCDRPRTARLTRPGLAGHRAWPGPAGPPAYPPAWVADGLGAGPRPARRHCGRVSSESLSWCRKAAWHIATALAPHACSSAPPVLLAAETVTQPLRDCPYPPGLTAAQMPRPTSPATIRAPTSAMPRLSRRVSGSGLGCWVFRYTAANLARAAGCGQWHAVLGGQREAVA